MLKFSHMLPLLALTACAANVGAPSEDPTGATGQGFSPPSTLAVGYNTPGPQYDPNGNLLGTHDNPFALIISQKFADPTHRDFWAIDPTGNYGTFHQPIVLSGVLQYKWIQCGAPGAGC